MRRPLHLQVQVPASSLARQDSFNVDRTEEGAFSQFPLFFPRSRTVRPQVPGRETPRIPPLPCRWSPFEC
jgi:hypothetical protein